MAIVTLAILFVVPVLIGLGLFLFRSGMASWLCGLIATVPGAVAIFGMAAFIYITADMSPCETPPCHNTGPMWFYALLVVGVVNLAIGFGLGMVGYFWVGSWPGVGLMAAEHDLRRHSPHALPGDVSRPAGHIVGGQGA